MKTADAGLLKAILDNRLADDLETNRISGAQLIVRQNGNVVYQTTVGYQDAQAKTPLREDAMFRLASLTKPVTGVAALIAMERGWFGLEDKVEDYLPQFCDMKVAGLENGRPVIDHAAHQPLRIWHLLSHCSGMMAECPLGHIIFELTPRSAFRSIDSAVNYCAGQPLAFDPTEYTAYSGYAAFDTVAKIIEMKSGQSYAEFVRQNIFMRLGLSDLTFTPSEEQWGRMITMTDRASGRGSVNVDMGRHTFERFPLTYTCAGASLTGTLHDYSIFAEMLRGRGSYQNVQIFSPELLEELRKPRVPLSTPNRDPISSWGLGVRVVDQLSHLPVGSFGWSGAYGTHFWVDTENEISAVYLRNSRWYDSHGGGEIGLQFEKDVMACLK